MEQEPRSAPDPGGGPVFSNRELSADELPDFSAVSLNRVDPAYYRYSLLGSFWFWPLVGLASFFTSWIPRIGFDTPLWVTAVLILLVVPNLVLAWLAARCIGWALREHDLIYRSGVIWRRTVVLPFTRIQHVETMSGPLERALGLMRVQCFTAGGMTADLTLHGLSGQQARRVRQFLLEQIRDSAGPGAEDEAESESGAESELQPITSGDPSPPDGEADPGAQEAGDTGR